MFTTHRSPLKCGECNDVITCHVISIQLTVQCQQKKRAPHQMRRGSATTDGQFAYFTPHGSTPLYQYEYSTEKWSDLPPCPYRDSGLAIIDNELTTVGGGEGIHGPITNKLFTLQRRKWVEKYPPMNIACSSPAVVSTSDGGYLILIGGYDGDNRWTATIELFQVKIRRQHKLTDLPQPLPRPSATICGDQLNVIGNGNNGYSCSFQALPSSDRRITSPLALSWKPLPRPTVTWSTAATLCGQLVIIGDREDRSPVNSIHQLVDGEWVKIGSMASDRFLCLVASPSSDRIIIVGGGYGAFSALDSAEECAVV